MLSPLAGNSSLIVLKLTGNLIFLLANQRSASFLSTKLNSCLNLKESRFNSSEFFVSLWTNFLSILHYVRLEHFELNWLVFVRQNLLLIKLKRRLIIQPGPYYNLTQASKIYTGVWRMFKRIFFSNASVK